MNEVESNDNSCGVQSSMSFDLEEGASCRIAVDAHETGKFARNWNRNPPPEPPSAIDYRHIRMH